VLPVVFTAAVLGLTSAGELLLGMPGDTVVTSAHLGATAGVMVMAGSSIEWPPRWRWLRWPYPAAVFAAGVALHGLVLPAVVALALGVPSVAVLLRVAWMHRSPGTPVPS
jgi:uncharacterized membrane protein YoaK (UPF0700 family)